MSLFPRVRDTIAATLRVRPDEVTPATIAADLANWDSLGHVNLMMALEQTFGVYVEVEQFETLQSVPAIVDFLAAQGVA